ncbi:MAG: amidohydrolase family protein [Bacteroidota bacterium]
MKYYLTTLLILLFVSAASSQIHVVDPPKPNFEERISSVVNEIRIIDTHEHLATEEDRLQLGNKIDFTFLFRHYVKEDLISSSNNDNKGLIEIIYQNDFSLSDRWEILKPIYKAVRSTGYGRVPLIAARDLYEVSDINESTIEELSSRMKEANKPGLYQHVLKEKAKIDLSIQDMGHRKFDENFYRHVERFDHFVFISSGSEMVNLGKQYKIPINTLDDYNNTLKKAFKAGIDYGMVGVKSALAYKRILEYKNVSKKKAEKIFTALLNNATISSEDIKALQDYFMHRLLDLVDEFNLPIQIHTGLHAGNGNLITNSKPTHLVNLFFEYPNVDFILFHASYPYGGELGTLAKNFPNVFIDMCWAYVISPSYSKRYLHEWIETVPANKIMGFGGDYSFVEAVYAHSVMARQIISDVLIEKVRDQYLTENEAIDIAKMILRENAEKVFKLNDKSTNLDELEVLKKPGPLHDWWEIHKTNAGFIRSWKVIGIFDFGTGLNEIYPPEEEIELSKNYNGKGGMVQWQTENISPSGYLNLISVLSKRNENVNPRGEGIAYAYTEVISPDDREVKVTLGSNDGAKMWINNDVVYSLHVGRNAVADQEIFSVKLKKGTNKILVKVENIGASWGLYMRIVDPNNELKIKQFKD